MRIPGLLRDRLLARLGRLRPARPAPAGPPGAFIARTFANPAGARDYKLYIPRGHVRDARERAPLVVMLHGCTQSPDDFAAGTRMNELAERHGFLVAYPAQARDANAARCWNWFRAEDQARDGGEPSILAGITREVAAEFDVDERRIFVAGLSAGAAMAVILGATYPELYAAVGVHSGLPYGSARDVASALAAMRRAQGRDAAAGRVPAIIFHGDADRTVHPRNAARIVEQLKAAHARPAALRRTVRQGAAPGGHAYVRTEYLDLADRPVLEHWTVLGAGHAWSGGSGSGTYTDAAGPDASAEMVRFFLSQRRAGTS